jgi:hypothetical protein
MWSKTTSAIVLMALLASFVTAKKVAAFHFPKDHPFIATITSETFREDVLDQRLPIAAYFYSPTSKQNADVAPVLDSISKSFVGFAKFVAIDGTGTDSTNLAEMFGVKSFPALLLFNPEMMPVQGQDGQYMKMPTPYQGDISVEAIAKWLLAASGHNHISVVDDLVEWQRFVTKFAGFELPRVVLMTEGNVTAPGFIAASQEFRHGALFAVVHGVTKGNDGITPAKLELLNLLGALHEKPRPLLAIVTGATLSAKGTSDVLDASDFKRQDVIEAVEKVATPLEKRQSLFSQMLAEESKIRQRDDAAGSATKALGVVVAASADVWEKHCVKKRSKGVCVAVLVESVDEAPMEWLEEASRKMALHRSGLPAQIVVVPAWPNTKLADFFTASGNGYPTVVFINPAKRVYHNIVGSVSEAGVVAYYSDKITAGAKGHVFDIDAVPKFRANEDDPVDEDAADVETEPVANTDDGADEEETVAAE